MKDDTREVFLGDIKGAMVFLAVVASFWAGAEFAYRGWMPPAPLDFHQFFGVVMTIASTTTLLRARNIFKALVERDDWELKHERIDHGQVNPGIPKILGTIAVVWIVLFTAVGSNQIAKIAGAPGVILFPIGALTLAWILAKILGVRD